MEVQAMLLMLLSAVLFPGLSQGAQRTILTTETGWTQFFTEETFFLKCVVQRDPAKWTIKRKKDGKVETACTAYSLENIQKCSFISPSVSHSGKYWCESESGECSNTLNITVYSGDVILRVSPQPLSKGSTGNLSCAVRHNPNHTCGFPSIQNVVYFRNGLILHNQKNSTHDEGHFKCRVNYTLKCQKSKTSYSVESPDILVSMTGESAFVLSLGLGLGIGLGFTFLVIFIILLLRHFRNRVGQPWYKASQLKESGALQQTQPAPSSGRRLKRLRTPLANRVPAACNTEVVYENVVAFKGRPMEEASDEIVHADLDLDLDLDRSTAHSMSRMERERDCQPCPERWVSFKEKCYFYSSDRLDWTASEHQCMAQGGHLVIVETEEEQAFLWEKANRRSQGDSYWIGLTGLKGNDGDWLWVDNTPLKNDVKNDNNKDQSVMNDYGADIGLTRLAEGRPPGQRTRRPEPPHRVTKEQLQRYWGQRVSNSWNENNKETSSTELCVRMTNKPQIQDTLVQISL